MPFFPPPPTLSRHKLVFYSSVESVTWKMRFQNTVATPISEKACDYTFILKQCIYIMREKNLAKCSKSIQRWNLRCIIFRSVCSLHTSSHASSCERWRLQHLNLQSSGEADRNGSRTLVSQCRYELSGAQLLHNHNGQQRTHKLSLLTRPCICEFIGLQLRSQDSFFLLFQQTKAEYGKRTALNGAM